MNNLLSEHYIDCITALNRSERMKRRPKSMRVTVELHCDEFTAHPLPNLDLNATLVAECTVYDDGSVEDTRSFRSFVIYDDGIMVPDATTQAIASAFKADILRALTKAVGGYEAVHDAARQERDRQWHAMQQEAAIEKRETLT